VQEIQNDRKVLAQSWECNGCSIPLDPTNLPDVSLEPGKSNALAARERMKFYKQLVKEKQYTELIQNFEKDRSTCLRYYVRDPSMGLWLGQAYEATGSKSEAATQWSNYAAVQRWVSIPYAERLVRHAIELDPNNAKASSVASELRQDRYRPTHERRFTFDPAPDFLIPPGK
jgi:hypothetical protein